MRIQGDPADLAGRCQCFFVTTATRGRRPSLGHLRDSGVHLTVLGHHVVEAWDRIGLHRPWVSTGPFVVMPDHVHGLLWWDAAPMNRASSVEIIVGGWKADATREARRANVLRFDQLLWQPGFRSRAILNQAAFDRAAQYIINNPAVAWAKVAGAAGVRVERGSASPPPDGGGSAGADIASLRGGASGDPSPRTRGRIP
jgi:REP element-mobilizing transposase RayT